MKTLLGEIAGVEAMHLRSHPAVDEFPYRHVVTNSLRQATSDCSPARGSRYNSALRYVNSAGARRLAVVISDDRTIDIVPLLKPQIQKSEIEKHIVELESAPADAYHSAQNWLNEHRFYLNEEQCVRINRALERLDSLPKEVREIRYITSRFQANPDLDDSYLLQ